MVKMTPEYYENLKNEKKSEMVRVIKEIEAKHGYVKCVSCGMVRNLELAKSCPICRENINE